MISITPHPTAITLAGPLDEDLAPDGGPAGRWLVTLDNAAAAALGRNLTEPHLGTTTYPADGRVGPFDGRVHDVLEVGTQWRNDVPLVVVVIRQRNAPEDLPRYGVAELTADEARRLHDSLTAAP
jgi:hypothetical protein